MITRLTRWLKRRRLASAARASAWRDAQDLGSDGLTNFQRLALCALEPLTGHLTLTRAGSAESYLTGSLCGTDLVLYLYADEAQVHSTKERFIAEKWDYDSPNALANGLVSFVRARLQSNPAPHRDGREASHPGQSSSAPSRGRER